MQNKLAAILIACILTSLIFFEVFHPAGWFYSYYHPTSDNTIPHKKRKTPIPLPITAEAYYVTYSNSTYATGWSPQRHTFYDGSYFWVFLFAGYTTEFFNVSTYPYVYVALSSANGENWSSRQRLLSFSDLGYHLFFGQSVDVRWDEQLGRIIVFFPYNDYPYWVRLRTTNGTMTRETVKCWISVANHYFVSPRFAYTQNYFIAFSQAFQPVSPTTKRGDMLTYTTKDLTSSGNTRVYSGWGAFASDTGESVTLTWNSTHAIYVTVKNDYTLAWNYATSTAFSYPPNEFPIKLAPGFNSLSGCSEPELNGFGNGTVDIVYIKNNGELCLMTFNGTWSSEVLIATSGATNPNIACAQNGDRYIAYIKDGRIYYRIYNVKTKTLSAEIDLCPTHQYNNVRSLSSNQMVQKGYICYTWTEDNPQGPAPYAVWFAALKIP